VRRPAGATKQKPEVEGDRQGTGDRLDPAFRAQKGALNTAGRQKSRPEPVPADIEANRWTE
jgi:hypothetical protein